MTEQVVVNTGEILETPQEVKKRKAAKRRRKKIVKNIFVLIILACVVAAGYLGFKKLFAADETELQALTDFTYRGSITTKVTGGGVTTPLSSEAIKTDFKCTIESVIANAGTNVLVGDPLYTINTDEIAAELEAAQKTLATYEKEYQEALKQPEALREQIAELEKKINALTVYAPFSGKVIEVATDKGATVGEGSTICKLVDDSKMLLTLYFSYAYENDIKVGDKANISIPSTMSNIEGTVKEIAMVERISAEGTKLFEVTFEMKNGGTLTEDVDASASITLADGSVVTPYEAGKLKYYEVKDIVSLAGGEVTTCNIRDYAVVDKGDKLIVMTNDSYTKEIADLGESITTAENNAATYVDKITEQQKVVAQLEATKENNVVYAPINGMVTSVMIIAGQTVEKDYQVMTISDSSVMTVEARIDSLNINDVKVGSPVTLIQYGMDYDTTYIGEIADISLEGKYENNYSYFPATIRVDNPDGKILSGYYIQYEIIANEAVDCVIAPAQCVKNTDAGTVVFVKADAPPENAVDLGESVQVPEGFYPVLVTTGLSDNYSVEIKDGVGEGVELFLQYMTDSGSSYQNGLLG